ncbi:BspA family leucine-rich repeat surface protein [Arabiibacter massiliensis]|uniref:BspA family leucine-rich repeat surface protein n=1 Tax=Arabiibacter massiliensis TaxID=1870985 RepID=UPI0009B93BEC|nr:BspA family leucine-rich repeat surface protein [Arabiibacter massiliensis]
MFASLDKVEEIDLSGLDTSRSYLDGKPYEGVTGMAGMFKGCASLATVTFGDHFDTSLVESMADMFSGCEKLVSLDMTKFDTTRVKSMSGMFAGCSSLESLDVSKFITSSVEDMSSLFSGCRKLDALDLTSFDTAQVTSMNGMFKDCAALADLNLSGFNTSKVTDMAGMFEGCTALKTADLSSFDTANVGSMGSLFAGAGFAHLDLSSFDTANATDMGSLFAGCSSLVSVDMAGAIARSGANRANLFQGCDALAAVNLGQGFSLDEGAWPVSAGEIGGTGAMASGQWTHPQGAGWHLAKPVSGAYALFDWEVRNTGPALAKVEGTVSDPGQVDSRAPKGWIDAAGNPVIFGQTGVSDGSAAAFSAVWDQEPFSLENYIVSPSSLPNGEYDGATRRVTVVPKNNFVGAVTGVSYVKNGGDASSAAPKDAGTYEVVFNAADSPSYKGNGRASLGSFAISPYELISEGLYAVLSPIYQGTTESTNAAIKLKGGNIPWFDEPLEATASVKYPWGTDPTTSHNDATVSEIQLDSKNYELPEGIKLERQFYEVLEKMTPALTDFSITLPGDSSTHEAEYSGGPQAAEIKAKQNPENMGEVTVFYTKEGGGAPTKEAPTELGTYQVTFDVADGVAYKAKKGLDAGTFSIVPRALTGVTATLGSVEAGTTVEPDKSIELTGGSILPKDDPLTATATVRYLSGTAAGDHADAVVKDIVLTDPRYTAQGLILNGQSYTVNRKTPKASDFENSMPTGPVAYNGAEQPVSVTAKAGLTGMGAVTVYYAQGEEPPATAAPKDAGTYEVTFKVAQGTAYEAGSFSLGELVISPIALDTSVEAALPEVYQGAGTIEKTPIKLTGGPILSGDSPLDATATVTHPSSANGANTYQDAAVSAIELTSTNYTAANLVLEDREYTVLAKGTPKAADFDIGPLADIGYDGQEHPVSVTPKSPDMGAATVKYAKDGGDATSIVPKDAGTYQVLIDVADSTKFWDAQGLDGGTFTIEKRELNGDEAASGLGTIRDATSAQNVSVMLTGGNIVPGEKVTATASEIRFPSADVLGPHKDGKVTLAPLPADSNYRLPGDSLMLTEQDYNVSEKPVPTVDQFVATPVTAEYDGAGHGASVASKDGVGAATNLRYLKGATPIEGAPIDAGAYAVMFDVEEGSGYSAAKDVVAQGAVIVTPRVLDNTSSAQLAAVPQRTLTATNVAVTLSGGRILSGEIQATASSVSYPSASAVGPHDDATVKVASLADAPNYALPADGLVLTDQAYTVTAAPYPILNGQNGSWEQGSDEGLSVRVDADIDKHRETYVDDKLVDPSNYTVTEGSTIVMLKPAYLATLAPGAHTLRLVFEDGIAETAFTVAEASGSGGSGGGSGSGSGSDGSGASDLAPTGDAVAPFALAAVVLAGLAGAVLSVARRARR